MDAEGSKTSKGSMGKMLTGPTHSGNNRISWKSVLKDPVLGSRAGDNQSLYPLQAKVSE
jgi:hypothetical protein